MTHSLAERLEAARRSQFVGREKECTLFRNALSAAEPPFNILHVYGPGGVGKTTLLREFDWLARESGRRTIHLDARTIEPSPSAFQGALRMALDAPATQTPQEYLRQAASTQGMGHVIFIDTSELLTPLDNWLRDEFFPAMPSTMMTVFSGRNPPSVGWRTDPGWQPFVRFLQLRNLDPKESEAYLNKRQIPAGRHRAILNFTHGHPLALSLVVDLHTQHADTDFRPEAAPNVIAALIDRLIANVPSVAHRAGLEACAMVRLTTEPLLTELLDSAHAHEIFAWLRTLSFMEAERGGIFPHDLAREALTTDLRWRNAERYANLHARARAHYMKQFAHANHQDQQTILHEYVFLHRDNPVVRPFFEWQEGDTLIADTLHSVDKEDVLDMVEQHEGRESAQIAAAWLNHPAQETIIIRDRMGQIEGMLMLVALERTNAADRAADPAVAGAWRLLETQTPLRAGERATLFRFWLSRESYQDISPAQSRIFVTMVQHYLTTPGLAYTLVPCANADFWEMISAYSDLHRQKSADFVVGGRHYGVYGHDWRVVSPLAWLNLMAEREIEMGIAHTMPPVSEALIVLSEAEFTSSVHEALRTLHDANALRNNPLLRSRLIVAHTDDSDEGDARIAALRKLIQETAAQLQATPRQMKFYRTLHHTYFQPAATQELAAELLDLPFSTYRRHLRSGIDFVAEALWQQELNASNR